MTDTSQANPTSSQTIESDTPCRRCGYNLRGLSDAGQCPECGAAVASSLGRELLVFADPNWLASLLRGARMWLRGIVLFILLFVSMFFVDDVGPAHILRAIYCIAMACIVLSCATGAWLLSRPDPSGLGEREYGVWRRIARCAAMLGVLQCLLDIAAVGSDASSAFAAVIVRETALAQFIGIVGVFSHLQYLQKLTERITDRTRSGEARFLKIALTIAWGIFYLVTLLLFNEFGVRHRQNESPLVYFALINILVGGVLGIIYLFFLFFLGGTLARVIREARSPKA